MVRPADPAPSPARRPGPRSAASPPGLAGTAGLVALTWGVLAAAPPLFSDLAPGAAHLVGFGLCSAVALGARHALPRVTVRAVLAGVAGLGAGWLLLPGLGGAVLWAGGGLGIPGAPPEGGARGPALLVATCLLAPIFEEIVYRERLLPALAARIGNLPGLLLSSAAFALPHGRPWSILGGFAAGLVLGSLMLAGRRLAPCVGLHAGLNLRLAALEYGA